MSRGDESKVLRGIIYPCPPLWPVLGGCPIGVGTIPRHQVGRGADAWCHAPQSALHGVQPQQGGEEPRLIGPTLRENEQQAPCGVRQARRPVRLHL